MLNKIGFKFGPLEGTQPIINEQLREACEFFKSEINENIAYERKRDERIKK